MAFAFIPNRNRGVLTDPFRSNPSGGVSQGGSDIAGTYTNHNFTSFTNYDDGYGTPAIPLGFSWGNAGNTYTEYWFSTNGMIQFGTGGSSSTTINGFNAYSADLWFQPQVGGQIFNTVYWTADGKYINQISDRGHGLWYNTTSFTMGDGLHYIHKMIVYCGRYGSEKRKKIEHGYQICFYKNGSNQYYTTSLIPSSYKATASNIGPQPAAVNGSNDYTDTCWYSPDNGSTYYKRGKGTCIVAGPTVTSTSGLSLTALNDKMMYSVSQTSAGSAITATTGSEAVSVNQSAQIAILNYVVGNSIKSQNEQEFRNFMLQQDNTGYGKLDLNSSGAVDTTDASFIGNQLVGNLSSVNPTAYARFLRVVTPSDSSYIGKSDFGGSVFAGGFFNGPTRTLRSVWAAGYPGAIINGTTHASTVQQNPSSFDTYIGNGSTKSAFFDTVTQPTPEPAMTNPVFYEGRYDQAAPTYYWYESYGSGSSTKTLQIYWAGTLIVNGTYAIGTTSYNNGTNNYVRNGVTTFFAGGGASSSSSDKYGNVTAYYAVFQATTSL